ncbi:DUF6320 domain-containing protein [Muricomes intestini]|uniref:Alcohol acetyltransferase n=2 Tax=Muricomes intestini TaxID=1796634 RepID=A0A4R3K257_9FIRM|nr:DUF6320 domain-containing protein [Muricomes intestini]TCS76185.1 hypothetical protein EDD59_1257 [Muricomes intestini]HAX53152.1 hypothetical protein [Lachnospiraceae bacterium]HCR82566.1 hypothetical protein [Lachnospiraceae bacterium]
MQQTREYWRKLDNAAKLYSATSNKKDTRVFRFYCILKEEVNPEKLQEALDKTLNIYPVFLSVMRKGMFWHYLEKSGLRPAVAKEHREPCSNLYVRDKKALLFEVTYYGKRINFEVFHALTDGTGATEFLRELVKNYLYLSHKADGLSDVVLRDENMTVQDQENDSFSKYYSEVKRTKDKKPGAIQLKKLRKEAGMLQINERVLSVKAVLSRSRELGVSMTVFLATVYMMAIHREMSRQQEKHPVVLMVPVNLRKFFPSDSMLNFFNWIEPGYDFSRNEKSFEAVQNRVKEYFETELTTERIAEHMNELIALEMHPVLRLAPLELKNLCIKAGAHYAEKNVTAIFSNMSAVHMPEEYIPYIDRFGVFTNTPKMELCMCSFGDKLSLGFTSRYDTENIQRNFYRILKEQGIQAEKVEPEYPQPDVPRELEIKIFRIYSFLCLAAAVAFVAVDFSFHPQVRWPLFTAAGIGSMWLATWIGFAKRYNLMKNVMWQLIIVSLGCILWDISTGWHGWSVDFVLPIVCMSVLLSMLIIAKIQRHTAREYMIYFVMAGGYGVILPLILLLTGVTKLQIISIVCVVVCFLVLAALIIFREKEFREEMHKKFHV